VSPDFSENCKMFMRHCMETGIDQIQCNKPYWNLSRPPSQTPVLRAQCEAQTSNSRLKILDNFANFQPITRNVHETRLNEATIVTPGVIYPN